MSDNEAPPPLEPSVQEPVETEDEERDPLHIGNLVGIISTAYGSTVGHVAYRDLTLVRIIPQEASDRAVEFAMTADGSNFAPELGVNTIEIFEEQISDYYVDFLGAQPGNVLEFFDVNGGKVLEDGEVAEVFKTDTRDAVKLADGRVFNFRGVGPKPPVAVIRVVSPIRVDAGDVENVTPADTAAATAAEARKVDILALLRSVQPAAAVEFIPETERSYPDSMQREDLFQDLLGNLKGKQRRNVRRIRLIEREVDLAVSLKNNVLARDDAGRVLGERPVKKETLGEAVENRPEGIPIAIPIVRAARVLNLEELKKGLHYNPQHVTPRNFNETLLDTHARAEMYMESAMPAEVGSGFFAYINDLLARDERVLTGEQTREWTADQDVIRTEGLGVAVEGLSKDLPEAGPKGPDDELYPPITLYYLVSDVVERGVRVLTPDYFTNPKTGEKTLIAPSDPTTVAGYVILPAKAALALRPPKRGGDLPTALLYTQKLEDDNLPTITETLRDLYTADEDTPLNAWTLTNKKRDKYRIADWLRSVLKYAVHPADAMGPRTSELLALLDSLGLGDIDLASDVAKEIRSWVRESQGQWRDLLSEQRRTVQRILDAVPVRSYQAVTDITSPLWTAIEMDPRLAVVVTDMRERNRNISGAPVMYVSSLLTEAQGDALPLVWRTIARLDKRDMAAIDEAAALASLEASRSYALRRKALRERALLGLYAEPEINPCPHTRELEAIRNVRDDIDRARLLREFIEEYQGGRNGEWITCSLCRKDCVCMHEVMELEALAQPKRMEAIRKQILIRFGGERYEGKIVCKNCGQGLQDIDYDDAVEFDDEGRPITHASVLTEEQMADPMETSWRKATEALLAPAVRFDTAAKEYLGDMLQIILERAGIQMAGDVLRWVVEHADIYVNARAPDRTKYEALRSKQLTSAATKIKTAAGKATGLTAAPDVPTYDALVDGLRIAALGALVVIALQTATPAPTVNNPYVHCKYSREGWPLTVEAAPDGPGPMFYVACVIASIQKSEAPWINLSWSGNMKVESRQKEALKVIIGAMRVIQGMDAKIGSLSFTPEIQRSYTTVREDKTAMKARVLVSDKDQLRPGFRPAPAVPAVGMPQVEANTLERVRAEIAGGAVSPATVTQVAGALQQQSVAIISGLNVLAAASVEEMTTKPTNQKDHVCCSTPIRDAAEGNLMGAPPRTQLIAAGELLARALPTTPAAGTHMWPVFDPPPPEEIDQTVDDGVLFKLFLKYCYKGTSVGEPHEFSVGNRCRRCGLVLGKPPDMIDIAAEGSGILAAQEGALRVEVTPAAFQELSDEVRRRRLLTARPVAPPPVWRVGLDRLIATAEARADIPEDGGPKACATALRAVLDELAGSEYAETDDMGRGLIWAPVAEHMDGLRAEVLDRIGTNARMRGTQAATRAQEAADALDILDVITEDPFIEGPRALQEYWCAKAQAAGRQYGVTSVTGSKWFKISKKHNDELNKLLATNANWWGGGVLSEDVRRVLTRVAEVLGPLLRVWIQSVRPSATEGGPWTKEEAQMVLRCFVLQAWRDAVSADSWMYADMAGTTDLTPILLTVSDWTRGLMKHARQQLKRYTRDQIRLVLQQRAELERTSIVQEFESIKDNDERAGQMMMKQLRIGRWGVGGDLRKIDPDIYDFFEEQRHRMGIVDPPVDPVNLEGAAAPAVEDYGLGLGGGAPEDGYEVDQGADGDNY